MVTAEKVKLALGKVQDSLLQHIIDTEPDLPILFYLDGSQSSYKGLGIIKEEHHNESYPILEVSRRDKIKFQFPTWALLECKLDDDKWYRVHASFFRAYDGPRRYFLPYRSINPFSNYYTLVHFDGLLFMRDTNQVVEKRNTLQEIIRQDVRDMYDEQSASRVDSSALKRKMKHL